MEIPITYHWGVVAAQLEAWQYKSLEKTAQGTLDELRSLVDPYDHEHQCVWKSIQSASLVRGGKESIVNGLVAIVVEEYDTITTSHFLRDHTLFATQDTKAQQFRRVCARSETDFPRSKTRTTNQRQGLI